MEFLFSNWGLIVGGIMTLASLFLAGDKLKKFKMGNESIFLLFMEVEKWGLLEGKGGADKLKKFMDTWKQKYQDKFGKQPSEKEVLQVQKDVADLSVKEKVKQMADPS